MWPRMTARKTERSPGARKLTLPTASRGLKAALSLVEPAAEVVTSIPALRDTEQRSQLCCAWTSDLPDIMTECL